MRTLVLAVALAAVLAGCAQPEDPALTLDSEGNVTAGGNATVGGAKNGTKPAPSGGGTPSGNETSPPDEEDPDTTLRAWPDLASATVRPGVQVVSDGGQCTSNFVFTSPDGEDVYLGLAAHCLYGLEVGSPVEIARGEAKGTVAYSSWFLTGHNEPNSPDGDVCTSAADDAECTYNDFALILVDEADEGKVHPAMLHFGGPVAMGNSSSVPSFEKVLTYGNSGTRFGIDETNWHEGVVLLNSPPWTTTIYTATPGVPGDSGSGVLLRDGSALGVLVTIGATPFPASNGVSHLDTLLAWAKEHGDIDVRLATSELLDPGLLPV